MLRLLLLGIYKARIIPEELRISAGDPFLIALRIMAIIKERIMAAIFV